MCEKRRYFEETKHRSVGGGMHRSRKHRKLKEENSARYNYSQCGFSIMSKRHPLACGRNQSKYQIKRRGELRLYMRLLCPVWPWITLINIIKIINNVNIVRNSNHKRKYPSITNGGGASRNSRLWPRHRRHIERLEEMYVIAARPLTMKCTRKWRWLFASIINRRESQ